MERFQISAVPECLMRDFYIPTILNVAAAAYGTCSNQFAAPVKIVIQNIPVSTINSGICDIFYALWDAQIS